MRATELEDGIIDAKVREAEAARMSMIGLSNIMTVCSVAEMPFLTCLRYLSWRALQSVEEFNTLAKMLQGNRKELGQLELDLIDWTGTNELWPDGRAKRSKNFFARDILKLEAGKRRVLSPRLRSLSLSAVSFRGWRKDMASAFNLD